MLLTVASFSLWFYNQTGRLSIVSFRLEGVLVDILKAIKLEQDFFNYETINPQFFRQGESEYLQKHHMVLLEVKEELGELIREGRSRSIPIQKTLINQYAPRILDEVLAYEASFQNLVILTQKRGFKDDGLEGRMRSKIHAVEDMGYGISRAEMLTLRRHEKDYIIRKDTNYGIMLENTVRALLSKIPQDPGLSSDQKEQVATLLKAYLTDFKQLEALESLMGTNNHRGIRGQMHKNADRMASLMEKFFRM
ncbi:MAG: hypothetical protein HC880_13615 [Bacteroidia bacterium]|nr:hypothetical protein [Bacteroidia bacterium]